MHSKPASKGNDGNLFDCAITELEDNPFWMLTFSGNVEIFNFTLTQRTDAYMFRLSDLTFFIGDSICVSNQDMSTTITKSFTCDSGPMIGKYFKVVLNRRQHLTICEVVITGAYV